MIMKKLFVLFLATMFFVPLIRAATPAFQDFDGSQFGTNANKVRIKDGASVTNTVLKTINPIDNTGVIGQRLTSSLLWTTSTNGVSTTRLLFAITPEAIINYTNGVFLVDVTVIGTNYSGTVVATNTGAGFIGEGSRLTNLNLSGVAQNVFINNVTNNNLTVTNNAFINNLTVTNNATFNGKVTLNSNVYLLNLSFITNALSTTTINAGQVEQALSTNNNIAFTGYSNVDGTNAQPFTLTITNTAGAAAPKFYQFPAGTLMLSPPFTNGVYNTNQGVFSGWIRPGYGTNGTWTGS